jgi:cell division protein FtsL
VNSKNELDIYQDIAINAQKNVQPTNGENPPQEENISLKFLIWTYVVMFVGFALLLPMIYIKNQIYYHSRDISALWSEYSILMEENRDLRQKIEVIRFKQKVLDTMEIE